MAKIIFSGSVEHGKNLRDEGVPPTQTPGPLKIFYHEDNDTEDTNTRSRERSAGQQGMPFRGRCSSQGRGRGHGEGHGRGDGHRGRGDNYSRGRGDNYSRGRGDNHRRGRGDNQSTHRGHHSGRGRGGSRGRASSMPDGYHHVMNLSSLDVEPSKEETLTNYPDDSSSRSNQSNTKNSSRQRSERIFGYRKLKELSEKDNSDEILMEILTENSGFRTLLKKVDMQLDWSRLLLCILGKTCSSNQKLGRLQLVQLLVQENFIILHVTILLSKIESKILTLQLDHLVCLIEDICKVLNELMQRMPNEVHTGASVIVLLKTIFQDPAFNLQANQNVIDLISDVSFTKDTIVKDMDNNRRESNMHPGGRRRHKDMEAMPPPDNFRELPILPDLKDLQFNEKPFLRKNKIDGSYDDLHHYLDVQFRLLREDYIQPLRNGIIEYRRGKNDKKQRFQDIRLYNKVKVVRPVCSNSGILHVIQFDVSKMQKMRWESSRRLLHGSLVCLSQDDFETILFATVTNRDVKLLQQGLIEVQFKTNFQYVFDIKPSEEFIMAETTAYFEAYRHILRGLQEIEDGLPMQRYIVECKQALKPPKYLMTDQIQYYDFSPLLPKGSSVHEYIPVINTRQWPCAEELQLDSSQYQAMQMALTKEMALIQGPPGTGKTFVGLKIMKLLLHNSVVWRQSSSSEESKEKSNDSILVVCYTNHALDQFLEGVSEFCDSIVRIGGRCNNPALEPFMLSNLRKEARTNRQVPKLIWERKSDCKKQMYELREQIDDVSTKLDASRLGILHEKLLDLHIREDQYTELLSGRLRGKDTSAIQLWLTSDLQNAIPPTSTSKPTASLPTEYSTYSDWMDTVIRGQAFELNVTGNQTDDLWSRKLAERLSVYKQWVDSYKSYKQKCIDEATEEIQALVEKNEKTEKARKNLQIEQGNLQSLKNKIHSANTCVLTETVLKSGLKLELRRQVDSLIKTKPNLPTHQCCVVEQWLHIDDTTDSKGLIREALDTIALTSETIDTLEEAEAVELERNIVDREDEEDVKKTTNQKALLLKAMDELAFTFSGSTLDSTSSLSDRQWQEVTSVKKTKEVMRRMLEQSKPMSEAEEARQPDDVWKLSVGARFSLYKLWLSRYQDCLSVSIQDIVRNYSDACDVYQEVMDAEDVDIISGSQVIAMTTTGAAKYRNILRAVNPKIIVVEEAAEVLESHIVSTINSNCQHLILIGDHKQLRPTPTVYQLAVKYNLEISLFERMINNKMNFVTLELQHRMRPEISTQMLHIYPELRDHQSVLGMRDVLGVEKNMYFIDHGSPETFHSETKSRSNSHEAEFMACLCKYLIRQGYKPTQITVLATYTGQVFALKKLMPKNEFEGVRVTAVDNYQGEENDIILLSLVRSNSEDNVGFLKTDNRVCVALSRAKMGFYVIGNFSLLSSQSILWANIVKTLKEKDAIGTCVVLRCQNHPEKIINASLKDDFSKAPNGGCQSPCNARLPCGHVCEQFCHILDKNHEQYRCLKPCVRTSCSEGHVCTKKCYKECGKCEKQVSRKIPMCGHFQLGPCHQDPHNFKCKSKCERQLDCGHICSGICGKCCETKTHHAQCQELIQKALPCGHTITCKCFERELDVQCTEVCTAKLDCGHACSGTCGGCFQGRLHYPCFERCTQTLVCGHKCSQKCSEPCPPCVKKCGLQCDHGHCSLLCGQPCLGCKEPCQWKCEHQECRKLCHEMCDRIACDMPCPSKLGCNHSCLGLCGEVCPNICYFCDEKKVKEIFADATPYTRFIALADCQHIIEKDTMDKWMRADDMEMQDFSPLEVKKCPKCSKPIFKSRRYGNIIKPVHSLINKVKQQLIGSKKKVQSGCQQTKLVLAKFKQVDPDNVNKLMQKLEPLAQVTLSSLQVVDIQTKLLQAVHSKLRTLQELKTSTYQKLGGQAKEALSKMKAWVMESKYKPNKTDVRVRFRLTFTPQELKEAGEEMLRLAYVSEVLCCAEYNHLNEKLEKTKHYKRVLLLLQDGRPMSYSLDKELVRIFKGLHDKNSTCPSIDEQRCIPRSVENFSGGQWLKCNINDNHVFTGDISCVTTCPQCTAKPGVASASRQAQARKPTLVQKSPINSDQSLTATRDFGLLPVTRNSQMTDTREMQLVNDSMSVATAGNSSASKPMLPPKPRLSVKEPYSFLDGSQPALNPRQIVKVPDTPKPEVPRKPGQNSNVDLMLQEANSFASISRQRVEIPEAYDNMDWESPEPRKRASVPKTTVHDSSLHVLESDVDYTATAVGLPYDNWDSEVIPPEPRKRASVPKKHYLESGFGVLGHEDMVPTDVGNTTTADRPLAWTKPTTVSGATQRISYDRSTLLQYRKSPLSNVCPSNLHKDVPKQVPGSDDSYQDPTQQTSVNPEAMEEMDITDDKPARYQWTEVTPVPIAPVRRPTRADTASVSPAPVKQTDSDPFNPAPLITQPKWADKTSRLASVIPAAVQPNKTYYWTDDVTDHGLPADRKPETSMRIDHGLPTKSQPLSSTRLDHRSPTDRTPVTSMRLDHGLSTDRTPVTSMRLDHRSPTDRTPVTSMKLDHGLSTDRTPVTSMKLDHGLSTDRTPVTSMKLDHGLSTDRTPVTSMRLDHRSPTERTPVTSMRIDHGLPTNSQPLSSTRLDHRSPTDRTPVTSMRLDHGLSTDRTPVTSMRLDHGLPTDKIPVTLRLDHGLSMDRKPMTSMRFDHGLSMDRQPVNSMRLDHGLPADRQPVTTLRLDHGLPADRQPMTSMRLDLGSPADRQPVTTSRLDQGLPVDRTPVTSTRLFQCIECDCNQLEVPGLNGRCQKHYTAKKISVVERMKKFFKD